MKIAMDAGHGPATPGKRSPDGSLREFQFNAQVAEEAKKRLMQEGHTVLFTHQPDRDVPLIERVRLANRLKADVLVSIHANAAGSGFNAASGIETYTYRTPLAASKRLAASVHAALLLATHRKDRGIKQADFQILRETSMPAILLECGFMTNRQEAELLKSAAYRTACAKAIAFGLSCYTAKP